jgi:NADH-quinone oxidoreductase subunit L
VILALHHQQDIWKMGGLGWRMPVTFLTFLVATLALCGVPPLSGFFSKDAILAATLTGSHANFLLFGLGVAVAILTTLYMFRLLFVVFLGSTRSAQADGAHESPKIMTWPLFLLAVPSALAGFWAIDGIYRAALGAPGGADADHGGWAHTIAMLASVAAVVAGFVLAWRLYRDAVEDPLPAKLGGLADAMRNRFYIDEFYQGTVIRLQDACAGFVDLLDRWIIAGVAVRGVHGTTEFVGRALRLVQTGNLRTYAFLMVLGLALVLYLALG